MTDRRTLLAEFAAILATPAASASAEDSRVYRRSTVIDSMAPGGPHFDVAAALRAVISGAVTDLECWPRDLPTATAALAEWRTTLATPNSPFQLVRRGADFATARAGGSPWFSPAKTPRS